MKIFQGLDPIGADCAGVEHGLGAGKDVSVGRLQGPGRLDQQSEGGAGLVLAGEGQRLHGRRDPRQEQVRSV